MGAEVVVAPVGNPKGYKEVAYVVGGVEVRERLSALAVKKAMGAERLLLLAGFSLCEVYGGCGDFRSGAEVVKRGVRTELGLPGDADVAVLPNALGAKFRFADRKTEGYFASAYREILKRLDAWAPSSIVVDTSHGINYMSLMAVEAARLAAAVLAASNKEAVEITVVNSEPLVGDAERLHVMELHRERITPSSAVQLVARPFLVNENKGYFQAYAGKCGVDKPFKWGRALFNGVYLYLAARRGEAAECRDYLEGEFEVQVKGHGGVYIYEKYPRPQHAYLHALTDVVSRIFPKEAGELSAGELENLARIYAPSEAVEAIVRNELDKLRRILAEPVCRGERAKLADITEGVKARCAADRRNLYAHGGLEKNVTYVKCQGGDLYFSYGECLDEVDRHL
ncbi:CRISPR-associated CARF protein Csx1 [Pyrobaculum sp.]|uniref:CRISPR-associated CARF protein Csx1 n=1 Tax=Pyrobaculum sp. TaxID=2004705 RepID=UPI003163440C